MNDKYLFLVLMLCVLSSFGIIAIAEFNKPNDLPPVKSTYITNDEIIWFATHADVTLNKSKDSVYITLTNPFTDFQWTGKYSIQ